MHFTSKLFITVSKLEKGKILKLKRFRSRSFTRWAKIIMANLAAFAGYQICGNYTVQFTPLKVIDIYGVEEDINLLYATPYPALVACGDSDTAFDEEQYFLGNFVAFADNYELLTDITLEGNNVKFSMRSYFVVVDDFTMKETALLAIFFDPDDNPTALMISRDLLETPYECKTDEVYIVDYEFVYGSG